MQDKARVVLDTNCLIASLSAEGDFHKVWTSMVSGEYSLCYSNDILCEYEEIIARLTNPFIASNVVQAIVNSPHTVKIDPYFHFQIIEADPDDNKFVDCAIAANAKYIVSEDRHFKVLDNIEFPRLYLVTITEFMRLLR